MGATYYLPRIVGITKAMQLLLSGDLLSAEEALQIGLVSQVIPPDRLLSTARELAGKIGVGPSIAVELTKRGLQRSLTNSLKSQLDYETYAQNVCRQSEDAKEGIRAFMEKRKPNFTGH